MKLLGIVYLTTFFAWLPIIFIGQEAYQQDHFQKLVTAGPEINFVGIFWYYNARFALDWLTTYLTMPVVSLLLISIIFIIFNRDKAGLVLLIIMILPIFIFVLFFSIWYPRYLLPLVVIISILFAYGVEQLTKLIIFIMKAMTGYRIQSP